MAKCGFCSRTVGGVTAIGVEWRHCNNSSCGARMCQYCAGQTFGFSGTGTCRRCGSAATKQPPGLERDAGTARTTPSSSGSPANGLAATLGGAGISLGCAAIVAIALLPLAVIAGWFYFLYWLGERVGHARVWGVQIGLSVGSILILAYCMNFLGDFEASPQGATLRREPHESSPACGWPEGSGDNLYCHGEACSVTDSLQGRWVRVEYGNEGCWASYREVEYQHGLLMSLLGLVRSHDTTSDENERLMAGHVAYVQSELVAAGEARDWERVARIDSNLRRESIVLDARAESFRQAAPLHLRYTYLLGLVQGDEPILAVHAAVEGLGLAQPIDKSEMITALSAHHFAAVERGLANVPDRGEELVRLFLGIADLHRPPNDDRFFALANAVLAYLESESDGAPRLHAASTAILEWAEREMTDDARWGAWRDSVRAVNSRAAEETRSALAALASEPRSASVGLDALCRLVEMNALLPGVDTHRSELSDRAEADIRDTVTAYQRSIERRIFQQWESLEVAPEGSDANPEFREAARAWLETNASHDPREHPWRVGDITLGECGRDASVEIVFSDAEESLRLVGTEGGSWLIAARPQAPQASTTATPVTGGIDK